MACLKFWDNSLQYFLPPPRSLCSQQTYSFLTSPGNEWERMGAIGHKWERFGVNGHKWERFGAIGHRWAQMGTNGHRWERFGTKGNDLPGLGKLLRARSNCPCQEPDVFAHISAFEEVDDFYSNVFCRSRMHDGIGYLTNNLVGAADDLLPVTASCIA